MTQAVDAVGWLCVASVVLMLVPAFLAFALGRVDSGKEGSEDE